MAGGGDRGRVSDVGRGGTSPAVAVASRWPDLGRGGCRAPARLGHRRNRPRATAAVAAGGDLGWALRIASRPSVSRPGGQPARWLVCAGGAIASAATPSRFRCCWRLPPWRRASRWRRSRRSASRIRCWRGRPATIAIGGFVEVREERRENRPHRGPHHIGRRPRASNRSPSACAGLDPQGHRAAGRRLHHVPRAAQPAARTAAARRLRLRPRHVLPGDRRDRLCARCDQDRPSRPRRRVSGCAMPRPCRASATGSTRASAR